MKMRSLISLALVGSVLAISNVSLAESGFRPSQPLCTGTRVLTKDGYAGTVAAIYLYNENQVEVQLDGVRGTDSMDIDDLALTNICVDHGNICVGDKVIAGGYEGTIAGLFINGDSALVNFNYSRIPDLVPFSQIALKNACELVGSCRHGRNRVFKK